MNDELTITGDKVRMFIESATGHRKLRFFFPTNKGLMTIEDISKEKEVPVNTVTTRIARYGYADPRIFSKERLPNGSSNKKVVGRPERDPYSIKIGTWELKEMRLRGWV